MGYVLYVEKQSFIKAEHNDHAQSLHNGGSNGIYNMQPLCQHHNLSKHSDNERYIEYALEYLNIPLGDYLDVVGISESEYGYILEWWEDLGVKEHRRFEW